MEVLIKGDSISRYNVLFHIKKSNYADTYVVSDSSKKRYFLKLINCAKLKHHQLDCDGKVIECEIVSLLNHANICKCETWSFITLKGIKYAYLVFENISGETLAEKLTREQDISVFDAKQVVIGVLNGLKYLHNSPSPIIHNELTMQNIMLDMTTGDIIPKIIDFGHSSYAKDANRLPLDGINPFYLAPEALNGFNIPQSDIFSVGVMLYHLIFGLPPHFIELSQYSANRIKIAEALEIERNKPIKMMNFDKFEFDSNLLNIISKAIALNVDDRFKTAEEFLMALQGEVTIDPIIVNQKIKATTKEKSKKGNGFADVAGMQYLKDQIQSDVIDLLENPEEYKKHGLNLPNGMLLYGPPGCGKTFFAEKLAEEVGFSFYTIKPSDIQSKWVNASQENIKSLFDEAKKQAPSIIFIDELDALMPNREQGGLNHMNTSVVNEFLAQMNNAGEMGLFIIGATNLPTSVDPAILRSGRLEQKFYLSPPDFDARKAMFEMYLKNRPIDFGLDYLQLASLTENYVASDIKYIADKSSRATIKEKLSVITQKLLIRVIQDTKPTVSLSEIRKHEAIHNKLRGEEN